MLVLVTALAASVGGVRREVILVRDVSFHGESWRVIRPSRTLDFLALIPKRPSGMMQIAAPDFANLELKELAA
jgi:hypothetical protein